MKKMVPALVVLVLVFLIVSFFIPARREKKVFVANTFTNLIASIFQPENWKKWDSSVSRAWSRDSTSCHFERDTIRHAMRIVIPGKTFRVTRLSELLYQVEAVEKGDSAAFGFAIIPFAGDARRTAQHSSYIVYAQPTNLFYKLLPFMEKPSFAERTVSALRAYLENSRRFYGYPIELKRATDTIFLTKKADIPVRDLFQVLPVMSKELELYAAQNKCRVTGKNLSYLPLDHDSISLMEGLNIDKTIPGDYIYNCRQLPSGQFLAVGQFEGRFRDRTACYAAMEKFLSDHQIVRRGLPFETYYSPLPDSDSSLVKITISYPVGPQ
jgi:hypothetical protein